MNARVRQGLLVERIGVSPNCMQVRLRTEGLKMVEELRSREAKAA